MVAPRREPDNSVNIRHIDIQIVNEEARKPVPRPRPASRAGDAIPADLYRHYVREVV
jgi:hypothetical protein